MKILVRFLVYVFITVIISSIMALPVMLLWDAVIPAIFKLPEITWLQAWFLALLCGFLFRSHNTATKE